MTHLPAFEDGTEWSETSAHKIQKPGNYPEESIQQWGFFSHSLTTVSSGRRDLQVEGTVLSFPGFTAHITRASFHAGAKCIRATAFNTLVRRFVTNLGTCLSSLFGVPLGLRAVSCLQYSDSVFDHRMAEIFRYFHSGYI